MGANLAAIKACESVTEKNLNCRRESQHPAQASFLVRIVTERDMRAGLGGARGMHGPRRTLARGHGTGAECGWWAGRGIGVGARDWRGARDWSGWCTGLVRACRNDSVGGVGDG
jgi:hypothetical protein